MASATSAKSNTHHALPAHEVVLLLETDVSMGLAEAEAERRLERYGPNALPEAKTGGPLVRFIRQFHHPLIYVLLVAGLVTLALGETVDASVIFGVVFLNATVGFVQEAKAEAALDALRSMIHTNARVRRDGHEFRIHSTAVVPGDVVLLETGDKAVADLRLMAETELEIDESALTGESVPVAKDEVLLEDTTPVADRRNMVYSGTLVTNGAGTGIAVATGPQTELGEIHRLVGAAENLATPLTLKLARFSEVLTVAILALAAVTFAVGVARGERVTTMVTAAVALAVGAIPEGLPAAVTITLAIGVNRMARRGAVIRRMPAVETLGSTTVVCSDKTGTLTENQMTVTAIWTPTKTFRLTGVGYSPLGEIVELDGSPVSIGDSESLKWSLIAGALCNDARLSQSEDGWKVVGDPTEGAMLVAASKAGVKAEDLAAKLLRVEAIPFSSEQQYMATLHASENEHIALVKGAAERVLSLCGHQLADDGSRVPIKRKAALDAVEELARDGLRVIATAVVIPFDDNASFASRLHEGSLVLTGLHAMNDPPRPAAISAVEACHRAGIDVKMITGDHALTASAIARKLKISTEEDGIRVLEGKDLEALDPSEYPEAIENAQVFARVSPEQKLHLVEGLQDRGNIVAMTGDGVNDAPALQQANIGVAMGKSGTEVAKEAADVVLTDDDFATIEAAVEEGRGVFDNLTKFIVWTLPTNMGEGLVILTAILLGATLPIVPVQILWINMTTAVALGLMLAFEPKEPEIMERPPREPAKPLLTGALVTRILLVSVLLVGGSWWMFRWEQSAGASLAEARTAAVNLFVTVEAFYLFSCRSLTRSFWHMGAFSNRWIIAGVSVQLVGQALLTYLPAMNSVFGTAPIGAAAWLRILVVATVAVVVVALDKRLRRRFAYTD